MFPEVFPLVVAVAFLELELALLEEALAPPAEAFFSVVVLVEVDFLFEATF